MAAILAFILLLVYPTPVQTVHIPPTFVRFKGPVVHASQVNVPLIPQQTCCWCWAASGQMVMAYFGVTAKTQQCAQAAQQFSVPNCCSTPFPNACVSGGSVWISHYGFTSQGTGSSQPLTFAQMQDQIDNRHEPWILNPHWPASGTLTFGHVLVGIGYKTVRYTYFPYTEQFVLIDDPWPPNQGNVYYEPYSQYVAGTYLGSQYVDGYDGYDITPPARIRIVVKMPFVLNFTPHIVTPPQLWKGPVGPDPETAARNSLPVLAALLDASNYRQLGFDSASPQLSLGRPLRVLSAELEPLRRYSTSALPGDVLHATSTMVFPVLSGGVVRSLIQVTRTSRGWEGVAFGQAGTAQLIDRYRAATSSDTLVHVPSLNQLFLARGVGKALRLTPIYDFEPLKMRAGVELSAHETFVNMAPTAKLYDGKPR
jgi:Papain-like cysteine protease AvrRpt2